jgi:pentatricopeptide repeat protein
MLQRLALRLLKRSRSAVSSAVSNKAQSIFATRSCTRITQQSNPSGFGIAICSFRPYTDKLDDAENTEGEDADFKRRLERSNLTTKRQHKQRQQIVDSPETEADPRVKLFTKQLQQLGKSGLKEAMAFWKNRDPKLKLNVISYNVMLTIYARNRAIKSAEALWKEMLDAGITPNILVSNTMLSAYKEVSNHNNATKFFTEIISTYKLQPTVDTYNVLIDLCAQKADIAEAIKFWKLMKVEGVPLEESTIHSLAKVIFSDSAKLYDPEALVRTLFAEIVENDLSPSEAFWNILLSARLKQDNVKRALEILELGRKFGAQFGPNSYVLILNYYCEKFQVEKALEILEKMKKQNTTIPAMYNNIVQMFLKLDDLKNAQKYSAEMLQAGFKPNVFYFTIMIQYFAEKDDLDAIADMFKEMQSKGIEPDKTLFDVWLRVPFKRKDIKGMEEILKIVEDRGIVPATMFFNQFLIVYSHYRDIVKCEKIYDKILELKLVPDINTFGSLGGLYALTGKFEKLAVLLEDVKRARTNFNQTNTVRMMVALLKKRQAAMAVELTTIMLNGDQVAPLEAVQSIVDLSLAQSPRLLVQLFQNIRQMYRGDLASLREVYTRPLEYLNANSVLYGDQIAAWKNNFKEMAKFNQLFADRDEESKYFRFVFMVAESLIENTSRANPSDSLTSTKPTMHPNPEYLANKEQFAPHSGTVKV